VKHHCHISGKAGNFACPQEKVRILLGLYCLGSRFRESILDKNAPEAFQQLQHPMWMATNVSMLIDAVACID
jgi:hypothetical protein